MLLRYLLQVMQYLSVFDKSQGVPHIVIMDESGCRRAVAAARIVEYVFERAGFVAVIDRPCLTWEGPMIPCQVRLRREATSMPLTPPLFAAARVKRCGVCQVANLADFLSGLPVPPGL